MKHKRATTDVNLELDEALIIQDRERIPMRGGYMIRPQEMSDDVVDDRFLDKFCAVYRDEIAEYTKNIKTSTKAELIAKWVARIAKMKETIKATKQSTELTDEEKRKKIARCLDIIANDKESIHCAIEYLKHRNDPLKEIIARKQKLK